MTKILAIFDIDDTLVESDAKQCVASLYLEFQPILPLPTGTFLEAIHQQMHENQAFLCGNMGWEPFLVTNRHPSLREELSRTFHVPEDHVYCRTFATLIKEILKIDVYPDPKARAQFFKDMHDERVRWIHEICNRYGQAGDIAIYFDDLAEKYSYAEFHTQIPLVIVKPIPLVKKG